MSGAESEGEGRATSAPRSALSAAAAVAALLLLLVVVAAASGGGIGFRPSDGGRETSQLFVDYAYTLAIVLAVSVVAAFALLLASARGGRVGRAQITGRYVLLVWGLMLLLIAGYKLIRAPERPAGEQEPLITIPTLTTPNARPLAGERRPDPQFRWEVALLGAAAAALAVLAYRRRRRAPEDEPGPDEAAAAVSAVLDEALDDLRAERDARRAVIAAYARLEATLAYHGLPRRAAEAPLEYLSRILLELEVTPEAVLDLTDLFEQAKFSRRRIDEAMKDEAIDALVAVRDDLRAAA